MATVFAIKHHTVAGAFRTRWEAEEYAASHPLEVHDREGVHTEHYEVVEHEIAAIVDCATCDRMLATSKDPIAFPYCKNCFYTGAAHEHMMGGVLRAIGEAIGAEVTIGHTGGGCFNVYAAVRGAPAGVRYGLNDGECGVEIEEGWGAVWREIDLTDEAGEYTGTRAVSLHYYDPKFAERTDPTELPACIDPGTFLTTQQAIDLIKADIANPRDYDEEW